MGLTELPNIRASGPPAPTPSLWFRQSHYREVPRWGVSNGARHNWKCFLTYKMFEKKSNNFLRFFFNFLVRTLRCFYFFCPWKLEKTSLNLFFSLMPTGPNPAQISIPVHINLPPQDISIMTGFRHRCVRIYPYNFQIKNFISDHCAGQGGQSTVCFVTSAL